MAKVIAEIGINHNGQLDIAKTMIAMAKEAGAAAVKFQVRDVDTVYAGQLDNPRNDGNPYGWATVGEQKRGIEFSIEDYCKIDDFCKLVGIPWFASYWDPMSYKDHKIFKCKYNKIASAMITDLAFCEQIALDRKYTLISTGGSTWEQIDPVMDLFKFHRTQVCVMHCVSQYPCPEQSLNLNVMHVLRAKYPWADIGYSGHEVGLYPSIMAMSLGARWIERHITLDRAMYGSDQAASMEFHGLQQLCAVARRVDSIMGDGIKKVLDKEKECMKKLRYWES